MAISLDAVSTGIAVSGVPLTSPRTYTHTVGTTGSNTILVVTVCWRGGTSIDSVTYNGVAMSQIRKETNTTVNSEIYYLVNPATGTNTVSISHSSVQHLASIGISLYGVDQNNPIDSNSGANGSSTGPVTTTLTTTQPNTWIIDAGLTRTLSSETLTMAAMTNRTQRHNANTAANGIRDGVSTVGPAASAGNYIMEWTKSIDNEWAITAAAFAPAGNYTRGNYPSLPADDTDLETAYSASDITDVGSANDIRVSQLASSEFAIHQYKSNVSNRYSATLNWEGQTDLAPTASTVYLQIYNRNSTTWETVDFDDSSGADTDFPLTANIADLTNYKDSNSIIACRVYQQAL